MAYGMVNVPGNGGVRFGFHTEMSVATAEGQMVFPIELSTFDSVNDAVMVQSGITPLFPGVDFSIENRSVVLKEGVPLGRTIGIYVLKNVVTTEIGESVSGVVIQPGTIPLDRLEKDVITSDTPLHLSIDENEELVVSDAEGTVVWKSVQKEILAQIGEVEQELSQI